MVEKFAGDVWVRLGYDKDDKSTWKGEKVQYYSMKPREYLLKRSDMLLKYHIRFICPDIEKYLGKIIVLDYGRRSVSGSKIVYNGGLI